MLWRKRLYAKYKVKILYKAPDPLVQNVSVDDDPATGPANCTGDDRDVQRFSMLGLLGDPPGAEKGDGRLSGKIRFVVRDFPLETLHEMPSVPLSPPGLPMPRANSLNTPRFFTHTRTLWTTLR